MLGAELAEELRPGHAGAAGGLLRGRADAQQRLRHLDRQREEPVRPLDCDPSQDTEPVGVRRCLLHAYESQCAAAPGAYSPARDLAPDALAPDGPCS